MIRTHPLANIASLLTQSQAVDRGKRTTRVLHGTWGDSLHNAFACCNSVRADPNS